MNTRRLVRIAGFLIILFVALLLAMPAIRAAEGTIPASVTISEAVTVQGVDPLEFGMLTAPQNAATFWTLIAANNYLNQSGDLTSTDLIPSDHSRGSFQIFGTPDLSVNFTLSVTTDFADPELILFSPQVYPASPQLLDANGTLVVQVGAALQINPAAAAGVHNDAVITMVANY
jgi:hypothetical protein